MFLFLPLAELENTMLSKDRALTIFHVCTTSTHIVFYLFIADRLSQGRISECTVSQHDKQIYSGLQSCHLLSNKAIGILSEVYLKYTEAGVEAMPSTQP